LIKVALDAMGGDFAPAQVIAGAILARQTLEVDITLVGEQNIIDQELQTQKSPFIFTVVHTPDYVTMDDHPSEVMRAKKDASIFVATRLAKEGRCDAIVSAGSTGAQMAGALFILGRFKGVDRPGIGMTVPNVIGSCALMCDSGAQADCKPRNLLEFGIMASAYMQSMFDIESPRVALVNIGEEAEKGSELTKAAHQLLTKSNLNFIGNIESKDVLKGHADVLVTDGFTGNIVLKAIEGIASDVLSMVKVAANTSMTTKIGGLLLKPGIRKIKALMDYSEYGGAPLLGVEGVSIVCHGRSNAKAIKSAIKQAVKCVETGLVGKIASAIN